MAAQPSPVDDRAHIEVRDLEVRYAGVPAVGGVSPQIIRMVVDLPAPFGPRKPVTTPGWTTKERSSTATVSSYLLVRACASIN